MPLTIPNLVDAPKLSQAQIDKVDVDALVAAFNTTGVISGCAVSVSSGMTVAVAAGSVVINGTTVAVAAGNVTLAAASTPNYRFDLIVVNNAGVKSAVTGTPSSAPVFPPIPANSVLLAVVWVPIIDSVITASQIIDKRVIVGTYSWTTPAGDLTLNGKLLFAPGDTNLYRSGQDQLKTDDSLTVVGTLTAGSISDSSLPARLQAQGQGPQQITDLNTATSNGWYSFAPGAANCPFSDYGGVHVVCTPWPSNFRQTVYQYSTDAIWMRKMQDGAWSTWWEVSMSRRVKFPVGGAGGDILFGGSAGTFNVNLYKRSDDNLQTDDTFWSLQNVVTGGKVYFNVNLSPNISSAGTDFTISHQTWAPSFVSNNHVYVDYTNVGGRLYFGSSGTSWLRWYSNNFIGAAGLMVEGPGYFQALTASYHNQGVNVYDSGNAAWVTMTGYSTGLRSSGHFWAASGYSMISGYAHYTRHDDGRLTLGVSDDVVLYRYNGTLRLNTTGYIDSVWIKAGEVWNNVTYVNGWGGYGAPYYGGQFRKTADNMVIMRGLITGGVGQTSCIYMPAGYRPSAGTRQIFCVRCAAGVTRIDVDADGYIYMGTEFTGTPTSWTSLAGIMYYAET
jgi:hypothetical protein